MTHTRLNFDIKFVTGNEDDILRVEKLKPLKIFSEEVCAFSDALSKRLLKDNSAKKFSDVVTFAFWCRKASIKQMATAYSEDLNSRLGRGIIFHIAPSNVAVNFAYSFIAGILAGNANIIRLPSKNFPQVEIICDAINEILRTDFKNLSPYIFMLRYGHEKEVTDFFSSICDVRVIWGGDDTIKNIRQSPLKARAVEITFADRYAVAVIQADEYLKSVDKARIAKDFFNDTYLTDQNACSSPKVIVWLGNEKRLARETFWKNLQVLIDAEYNFRQIQAVDKAVKFFMLAADEDLKLIPSKNNRLTRAEIFDLNHLTNFDFNSGFFIEYEAENLSEIFPICGERCQTLAHYGLDEETVKNFVLSSAPKGIDRIVELGRTLDFSLTWDGFDLIRSMSRKIFTKS